MQIGEPEARVRTTLDYRLRPNLSAGLEFNGHDREVQPRATWFATPARRGLPSATFGFSSDRLTTPRGQTYFATFAMPLALGAVTPFGSLKWSSDRERLSFPFGLNLRAGDWTLQALHDGDYTHLLLTRSYDRGAVSLMLARAKFPGLSYSFGL